MRIALKKGRWLFNPQDFFEFAKELRGCTFRYSEANHRTMMSRLYYASFLTIREYIRVELAKTPVESLYEELSKDPLIHGVVGQIVNIADTYTRGLLHKIRKKRIQADYQLQIKGLPLSVRVNQSFLLTEKLFKKQIPLLPSQISRNIMAIQHKVREWYSKMEERQGEGIP